MYILHLNTKIVPKNYSSYFKNFFIFFAVYTYQLNKRINWENPYYCENCQRRYKHKKDLNIHKKECGMAPRFCCPYCSYRSHRKYNVVLHISKRHVNESVSFN